MKNTLKYLVVAAALLTLAGPVDARAEAIGFSTPQEAVDALINAAKSADPSAELVKLLGDKSQDLAVSQDPEEQKKNLSLFIEAYDSAHSLRATKLDGKEAYVLEVGKEDFPMAVPIVRSSETGERPWTFDVAAGYEELLTRNIGRNELNAIQVCLAFVDAQREYYLMKPQGGRPGFASKLVSTQGRKDGLYWPAAPGEAQSPLGEHFAYAADLERRSKEKAQALPYHGYYYRMLPGQGSTAPGGAFSYAGKDGSVTGFALLAYPAFYGRSGVMSFMVNQDGVVYEKNLGPKSREEDAKIKLFNLDDSWRKVEPDSLKASADEAGTPN